MPTDDVLGDAEIHMFESVRKHFVADPDGRALSTDVPSHGWVLDVSLPYPDQRVLEHARRFALQGDEAERELARLYVELNSSPER